MKEIVETLWNASPWTVLLSILMCGIFYQPIVLINRLIYLGLLRFLRSLSKCTKL